MSFFESCDTLLGIHAFLNSVINSPQNTKIVLSGDTITKNDMKDRETAVRIEGVYRGTIALMQRISQHHDFRNNQKSIKKAIISIWISIFLGFLSIIISLILAYKNWNELINQKISQFLETIINQV